MGIMNQEREKVETDITIQTTNARLLDVGIGNYPNLSIEFTKSRKQDLIENAIPYRK